MRSNIFCFPTIYLILSIFIHINSWVQSMLIRRVDWWQIIIYKFNLKQYTDAQQWATAGMRCEATIEWEMRFGLPKAINFEVVFFCFNKKESRPQFLQITYRIKWKSEEISRASRLYPIYEQGGCRREKKNPFCNEQVIFLPFIFNNHDVGILLCRL